MFGNVYILYRRQACRVCRLDMFYGNMYVATTSALIWCIVVELVFPFQLPSFGQLPVNYSVFLDISGRSVLNIYEDGFTVSLQLAFLPFLTKFMKGLVKA